MTPPTTDSAQQSITIDVTDTQSHLKVDHARIRGLAERTLRDHDVAWAGISIVIVDNPAIRTINARHLNHDWPTDVITFPISDADDDQLNGELVVSAEMAVKTASEIGVDPADELALYVVHGLLHLCGYDDVSESDQVKMRLAESEALHKFGIANPFDLIGCPAREGSSWTS